MKKQVVLKVTSEQKSLVTKKSLETAGVNGETELYALLHHERLLLSPNSWDRAEEMKVPVLATKSEDRFYIQFSSHILDVIDPESTNNLVMVLDPKQRASIRIYNRYFSEKILQAESFVSAVKDMTDTAFMKLLLSRKHILKKFIFQLLMDDDFNDIADQKLDNILIAAALEDVE